MSHDLIRVKTSGLKLSFMKRVFRAPTGCTRTMFRYVLAVSTLSFALLGCQTVEPGDPDMAYGWGPAPLLKPPKPQTLPVMKLSKAVGWKPGERPTPTEGYDVQAFAQGLDHPRWLHALPNGDILVAETDAPQMSSRRLSLFPFWLARFSLFSCGDVKPPIQL